jgi:acetyl-CoA carboxylase biotin carboxyl carrier protein
MSKNQTDSSQDISFAELKEIANILKSAPDLQAFSLKFKNLELSIESGLKDAATEEPSSGKKYRIGSEDPQKRSSTNKEIGPKGEDQAKDSGNLREQAVESSRTEVGIDSNSNQFTVKSPMVGTYYKAPQPGAKPFVSIGDKVKKGDVVCLIEVMKLINSVVSDVDGVVNRIHVEDGQAVQHGQALISIQQS